MKPNSHPPYSQSALVIALLLLLASAGYGQNRPAPTDVLALGKPPLTRTMAEAITTTIGWLLDVPFTAEQRNSITALLVRDWQSGDKKEIEEDLDWLRIAIALKDKSAVELQAFRREALPQVLAALRANRQSADAAWLLAQYEAAHKPTSFDRALPAAESVGETGPVHTLGLVSFVPPEGWRLVPRPGPSSATMIYEGKSSECRLTITTPFTSSGDAVRDLRIAWGDLVTRLTGKPLSNNRGEHRPLSGYHGQGVCQYLDNGHYVCLTVLRPGAAVIPIVEWASPTRAACNEQSHRTQLFLEAVRLSPERAQPQKKLLSSADLQGEWYWSSNDNQIYVYRFGGAYAGSSTIVRGETVTIAADGSYAARFTGAWNGVAVRDQTAGSVETSSGRVRLREKANGNVHGYHLISYQQASDGATVMKLLPDQYEPTAGNISFYRETWVRQPAGRRQ